MCVCVFAPTLCPTCRPSVLVVVADAAAAFQVRFIYNFLRFYAPVAPHNLPHTHTHTHTDRARHGLKLHVLGFYVIVICLLCLSLRCFCPFASPAFSYYSRFAFFSTPFSLSLLLLLLLRRWPVKTVCCNRITAAVKDANGSQEAIHQIPNALPICVYVMRAHTHTHMHIDNHTPNGLLASENPLHIAHMKADAENLPAAVASWTCKCECDCMSVCVTKCE